MIKSSSSYFLTRALPLCLALLSQAPYANWQDERWIVEDFTWALGGGPDSGPVVGVGRAAHHLCGDAHGNLYLATGQFIDIVTASGDRVHLAGTGELGMRDGPAYQAEFRLGEGAYYHAHNLACTADGAIFIADNGNRRIRRLAKDGGKWIVSAWAGGGTMNLSQGQRASPGAVKFAGTIAVAVTSHGEVTVADSHGAYRVSADGKEIVDLGPWPASTAFEGGRGPQLNVMMGDADKNGNVYFVSRTPDVVLKIDAKGTISHFAGRVVRGTGKPHSIGDVAPRDAYFDTPTSLAVMPDGSAIFVCGGDEYAIRRIPGDGDGTTATLMVNGRWNQLSVHPNKVRGRAIFDASAKGPPRPEGTLTTFMINHLVGRDAQGNLYGILQPWVGLTQQIEDSGLMATRLFRIRRVQVTP